MVTVPDRHLCASLSSVVRAAASARCSTSCSARSVPDEQDMWVCTQYMVHTPSSCLQLAVQLALPGAAAGLAASLPQCLQRCYQVLCLTQACALHACDLQSLCVQERMGQREIAGVAGTSAAVRSPCKMPVKTC